MIDILVMDETLSPVGILDKYQSLIWTDRWQSWGDFEILLAISDEALSLLTEDRYISIKQSDRTMIIEDIEVIYDAEEATKLKVTGRSLESLLERRTVNVETRFSNTYKVYNVIQTLLTSHAISPSNANRVIPTLYYIEPTDPVLLDLGVTGRLQIVGKTLYDHILDLAGSQKIGFKLTLDSNNAFCFEQFLGVDRSYAQSTNSYVVFSPTFENMMNSNYIHSKRTLKTLLFIQGLLSGGKNTYVEYENAAEGGAGTGLARREAFVVATDINAYFDGVTRTTAEVQEMLNERGAEVIKNFMTTDSFEGEAEVTTLYEYNVDFNLGDILQYQDEYGHESSTRVVEMVWSYDENGYEAYPTFASV